MSGEGVFRELGRSLARARHGKLLHTSYTANGVRPGQYQSPPFSRSFTLFCCLLSGLSAVLTSPRKVHENLINRASSIVLVTADANRNLYQAGFTSTSPCCAPCCGPAARRSRSSSWPSARRTTSPWTRPSARTSAPLTSPRRPCTRSCAACSASSRPTARSRAR